MSPRAENRAPGDAPRPAIGPIVLGGQAGALAYAVGDLGVAALDGPVRIGTFAAALVAAAGLALVVGAILAVPLALLLILAGGGAVADRGGRATPRLRLRHAFAAASAAAVFIALTGGFLRFAARAFHDLHLVAATSILVAFGAAGIATLVATAQVRLFATRGLRALGDRRPAWLVVPLLGALAVLAVIAGRGAGSSVHGWVRVACLVPIATAAGVAAHRFARGRSRRLPWFTAAAGVALLATALSPVADDPELPRGPWRRSSFLPVAGTLAAPLLDRDGDGHPAVLGGGDCDDGDPSRNPAAIEAPANGVDEDCAFGDLALAPPASPAGAGRPLVTTAVLLTIAGLEATGGGRTDPALPRLEQATSAGLRFARSVGLEGRFWHVAPALLVGRLPPVLVEQASGFPWGGPSLPGAVERAGGAAFASLAGRKRFTATTSSLFRAERVRAGATDPRRVVAAGLALIDGGPRPAFLWVHLDLTAANRAAVDQAAARLVQAIAARPESAILIAALAPDASPPPRPAGAPRGGPLALVGAPAGAGEAGRIAGLLDAYPTLLDLLGLRDEPALDPMAPPVAGRSLLRDDDAGARWAVTGWLTDPPRLAVVGDGGRVAHDQAAHRFHAEAADGTRTQLADDAAPLDWRAPALELLRDRLLAARRQAHNRLGAAARRHDRLPGDASLVPDLEIGGLDVIGWSARGAPGDQLEIALYLRGGELLQSTDLLAIKLGVLERRTIPADGALEFGERRPGVVAHRILVDRRALGEQFPMRVGVARDGELLDTSRRGEDLPLAARVASP